MGSPVMIGYGLSCIDGRVVSIKDATRGADCNCVCPGCGTALIARQGSVRTWYFAHAAADRPCAYGPETALHAMVKQLLASRSQIMLPEYTVTETAAAADGQHFEARETLPSRMFQVAQAYVEKSVGSRRPDVLLVGMDGTRLALEVRVTHAVDDAKRAFLAERELMTIEFDVNSLPTIGLDEEELRIALEAVTPDWIFHPEERETRARLKRALQAKLLTSAAPKRTQREETLGKRVPGSVVPSVPAFRRIIVVDGVEVRMRSIDHMESVTVTVCTHSPWLRDSVLMKLAADARSVGVPCSTHRLDLGFFVAWDAVARTWAESVDPGRIDDLVVEPKRAGRPSIESPSERWDRLRLLIEKANQRGAGHEIQT